ncbi:MAG: R3H domain-containing nucleic acid-binding protein [Bacillota bacterium]|nr:R3H domain-containing nucleic acid-binding protein [Bacillota bacterium]
MTGQRRVTDNLEQLLAVLPPKVAEAVKALPETDTLIEIVLDLGRQPEARYPDRFVYLSDHPVTRQDLEHLVRRVGTFGQDNRAGIEATLHRISAIRNREGDIIGATCRIGRALYGTVDIIRDVVEKGKSILFLGRPGVGKTTMLREVARVLADQFQKRVIVVDTSNEIAGDGDIPHPAIGHARRMQVPRVDQQAAVMIEAVENHMPEVVVIDEIGTEAEAAAARTIAERGVQLIGTAHGNTLENLVLNPTLSDLIGGIHAVTLGDEEAKRRGTQKTVLERKAPPTFEILVEIQEKDRFAIHHDVAAVVDDLLRGIEPRPEIRERSSEGTIEVVQRPEPGSRLAAREAVPPARPGQRKAGIVKIFPYAVSRNRLARVVSELRMPVHLADEPEKADLILTLKGQYRKMPKRLRMAEERGLPIYVIRSNTMAQMESFLKELVDSPGMNPLAEAEQAIQRVIQSLQPVELAPQSSAIRRLQHELAEKYQLHSRSVGEEPNRRVTIYPHGSGRR